MFQPPVHPDKIIDYHHAGAPTLDGPGGAYYTEPNGGPTPRPNTVIDGGFVSSSDDELVADRMVTADRVVTMRHGEGVHNATNNYDLLNPELTPKGVTQAESARNDLKKVLQDLDAEGWRVVVSPHIRTLQTLQAALGVEGVGSLIEKGRIVMSPLVAEVNDLLPTRKDLETAVGWALSIPYRTLKNGAVRDAVFYKGNRRPEGLQKRLPPARTFLFEQMLAAAAHNELLLVVTHGHFLSGLTGAPQPLQAEVTVNRVENNGQSWWAERHVTRERLAPELLQKLGKTVTPAQIVADAAMASSAGPALPRAKDTAGSNRSGAAKGPPRPEEARSKRRKVDGGQPAAEMTTWDAALLQMREEDAAAPLYPNGFESWLGAEIRGSTAAKRDAWRLQQVGLQQVAVPMKKSRGALVPDLPTRANDDKEWGTPVTYGEPQANEGQPPSGSWKALQEELNMLGKSPPAAAAAPNTYVVDKPGRRLYHARPPSEFTNKKWQYLKPKSFHQKNLDSLQIADWQWHVHAPKVGVIETVQPEAIQQMLGDGWKGLPRTDVGWEVFRINPRELNVAEINPREHNVAILD